MLVWKGTIGLMIIYYYGDIPITDIQTDLI